MRGGFPQHLHSIQNHPSDLLQHRSGVLQNLVIPEPEHLVSPSLKPGRALIIVLNLIRMLPAVCLDDEPGLVTYQVGDEGTDAVLATELEPFQLPIAQM